MRQDHRTKVTELKMRGVAVAIVYLPDPEKGTGHFLGKQ